MNFIHRHRTKYSVAIIGLICLFLLNMPDSSAQTDEISPRDQQIENDLPLVQYHTASGLLPEYGYERPTVALALSGGGARGLAHIGVLQVFQEEGIPIDFIAGCSMGAIVGSLYGMGYTPDEIATITTGMDWGSLFSDAPRRRNLFLAQKEIANQDLVTLRFKDLHPYIPDALVTGQSLFNLVFRLSLNAPYYNAGGSFDSLHVPVGVVCTDLRTGNRVFVRNGNLPIVLRGAMAVPILFRPLKWDDYLLVDGGAVENIPVRAAMEANTDYVIAVDCATPQVPDPNPDELFEIANQVTTLMTVSNDSISRSLADVVIVPALDSFGNTEFDDVREIIEAGRMAAYEQLDAIRTLIGPLPEPYVTIDSLSQVHVLGVPENDLDEIYNSLQILTGEVPRSEVNAGITRMLRALREAGYCASTVLPYLYDDGTLMLMVNPGRVDDIIIEGISEHRQGVVNRELSVRVGEPLKTQALLKSIVQLHATGRYTVVYAWLERSFANGINVHLYLEEAPFPKVGIGMGFDSDRKSRYFAEFQMPLNLLHQGEELRFRAMYGSMDRDYSVTLQTNRLATTYLGLDLKAGFRKRYRRLYDFDGETIREIEYRIHYGSVNSQFNLYTWGTISAGLLYERVSDDLDPLQWELLHLNALVFRGVLDTEDRKPYARRGFRLDVSVHTYVEWLASERAFNIVNVETGIVSPVMRRLIGRLNLATHVADLTTPSSHRIRIGGMTVFPAFPPDRFLALRFVRGTAELRYDLISQLIADAYIIARYDVAAFSDAEDWRPEVEDLLHCYSAGFALDTMLGPIELFYSYTPESASASETYRLAVNFGYRF